MSVFAARAQAPFIAACATGRGSAGEQAHVSLLPELFVSGFIGKSQAAAERLPGWAVQYSSCPPPPPWVHLLSLTPYLHLGVHHLTLLAFAPVLWYCSFLCPPSSLSGVYMRVSTSGGPLAGLSSNPACQATPEFIVVEHITLSAQPWSSSCADHLLHLLFLGEPEILREGEAVRNQVKCSGIQSP